MKYRMINEYWPNEDVIVEMKKTEKTVVITPVSPRPKSTPGCIDDLWSNGNITIREPKPGGRIKITRHLLKDWGDGEYTLYPNREGIPFFMAPMEAEDGHQN